VHIFFKIIDTYYEHLWVETNSACLPCAPITMAALFNSAVIVPFYDVPSSVREHSADDKHTDIDRLVI